MSTRFVVKHTFDVELERYWRDVFFDAEFNRRLFTEALGFRYELVSMKTSPDGAIDRVVKLEPPFEIPGPAKALFPQGLGYTETGRFDPTQKRWSYRMTPKVFADRITTGGMFWVEPRGPSRIERFCEVDVSVKAFGVGGFIEAFIERLTRESYEKASAFTAQYLRAQPPKA